ncbi:MAG: hypothetical protein J6T16_02295 [Opitutales bacterium]|nr:hypothetical protein [Opitutales bacterium]
MLTKIYIFAVFFCYVAVFPALIICALEKRRELFKGLKGLAAIFIISLLSWITINAAILIPYALSFYRIRGPESAFALLFGWAYIWVFSIPAFALYALYKIYKNIFQQTGQGD